MQVNITKRIDAPEGKRYSPVILARLVLWATDRARWCCVTISGTAQFA